MASLATLQAAFELASPSGNGLCFHWAAALCHDLPGSQMVIGILKPLGEREFMAGIATPEDASPCPFYHAWVEYKGNLYAPTLIEAMGALKPINRQWYYNINGAHTMRRISRRDLLDLFKVEPALLQEIKSGSDAPILVDRLMQHAKLAYQLSERNGVIPNED